MRRFLRSLALAAMLVAGIPVGAAYAQGDNVRVIVPEVPGGVIVSGCYEAVGRIYGKYRFEFCLKQRATYTATGGGVVCRGGMSWDVRGIHTNARLQRARCGNGVAWSADTFTCRPSLLLSVIGALLKQKNPMLDTLRCDYTPARGTGEKPISFAATRVR